MASNIHIQTRYDPYPKEVEEEKDDDEDDKIKM